ncbi:DUF3347 domain-containing protein [Dinghuibacter silviterrae]|uniref:Uncharacterized protein DUF3347 n=1 Tax=Dinghuibacter silviterrae TaxID=1539049 RepID=A0A4R8DV02_9BACT|nr:DUF3347 domain-containing protein [Dinghuibacter silviterrae]TDX02224.1 uncharacterized protein DUF3347 [Dinghuibacter silviterrae]
MRRFVPAVCILLAALACNNKDKEATPPAPKPQPVKEGKYSAAFGQSLDGMMTSYEGLVTAFAKGDTGLIGQNGRVFMTTLDSLHFTDFAVDTLVFQTATSQLSDTRTELKGLLGEATLASRRQELNMVSQDLYDLLRTVRYDRKTLYLTECATALGDDNPGDWISPVGDTTRIMNPYLGAVGCAQIKDSLPEHP